MPICYPGHGQFLYQCRLSEERNPKAQNSLKSLVKVFGIFIIHDLCEASHDLSRVLPTACLAAGSPFGVRTAFPLYSLGSAVTLPQQ